MWFVKLVQPSAAGEWDQRRLTRGGERSEKTRFLVFASVSTHVSSLGRRALAPPVRGTHIWTHTASLGLVYLFVSPAGRGCRHWRARPRRGAPAPPPPPRAHPLRSHPRVVGRAGRGGGGGRGGGSSNVSWLFDAVVGPRRGPADRHHLPTIPSSGFPEGGGGGGGGGRGS